MHIVNIRNIWNSITQIVVTIEIEWQLDGFDINLIAFLEGEESSVIIAVELENMKCKGVGSLPLWLCLYIFHCGTHSVGEAIRDSIHLL